MRAIVCQPLAIRPLNGPLALSINVIYSIEDGGKRAAGFKLAEGMEIPEELASRFKFARQKSKPA